jgi:hypothetical protein
LGIQSLVCELCFLLLILSKILTVPCTNFFYSVNVLTTLTALQTFWKMMLGEILVSS